ncbi:hypothetical protein TEA_005597 [Camellia sinensis var. sinensis]|uniref:PPPDE domain-containing protein n=1 Tax=Camellia sinensis var. sinensis TaxID=542762 RepID=A0A4S4EIV3_CAMSN|nr:hypothetical protein TEA_005597 [Camellia sinensis var. sinensis]
MCIIDWEKERIGWRGWRLRGGAGVMKEDGCGGGWTSKVAVGNGVAVHGVEYAFGAHDYPSSGVFEVEPRQCPGFKFRKSILIGTTCLDTVQVREFMERHSTNYNGDTYHLIVKNCNHFCKDICYKLTGKTIPKWVNRLAKLERSESNGKSIEAQAEPLLWGQVENRIGVKSRRLVVKDDLLGSIFNCVLPKALKISAVEHDPSYKACDSEKRRLTTAFSCLSSISTRQRQLSTSSLFLQSPLKGCLPPWELRKSNNGSLKERDASQNCLPVTFSNQQVQEDLLREKSKQLGKIPSITEVFFRETN